MRTSLTAPAPRAAKMATRRLRGSAGASASARSQARLTTSPCLISVSFASIHDNAELLVVTPSLTDSPVCYGLSNTHARSSAVEFEARVGRTRSTCTATPFRCDMPDILSAVSILVEVNTL